MKGYLLLEDGTKFHGDVFGLKENTTGEVVFNTGMTGYQEVLTDPSYYGQIVVMTYPLIGNYGINTDDCQASKPMVKGFVIREGNESFSNWRGAESLEDYFFKHNLTGIQGIDTRALTKIIREKGTMAGSIVVDNTSEDTLIKEIQAFNNEDAVSQVTTKVVYDIKPELLKVAVIDFGIKRNILNSLSMKNIELRVFPADVNADDIKSYNPDGVFLSNGPGDPSKLGEVIENIKQLMNFKPIFGICLGHQLLAHAYGGETSKMKYGHRGSNHPVKDLLLDRVFITSQNHGFEVVQGSLDENKIEITHINVNDGTIEGMRHKELPIFSVQYHPEACPGPADSVYLFEQFLELMLNFKKKEAK